MSEYVVLDKLICELIGITYHERADRNRWTRERHPSTEVAAMVLKRYADGSIGYCSFDVPEGTTEEHVRHALATCQDAKGDDRYDVIGCHIASKPTYDFGEPLRL